jgi:hypothetical protein
LTDSAELLVLRLALLGVIFAFVLLASAYLRGSMRPRIAVQPGRGARYTGNVRIVVDSPGDSGLAPGTEFALAGKMTLGRDEGSSIVLRDDSVSAWHAEIERTRRGWYVTDLDSTNGVLVNGQPVGARRRRLQGGEEIAIGAVILRFQA